MKRLVFILVFFSSLVSMGCAFHTEIRTNSEIDTSDKSVIVPFGGESLQFELKDVLRDLGWKVFVLPNETVVTAGTQGTKTELVSQGVPNSKYRLLISAEAEDYCVLGGSGKEYKYEISFIDNNSGEEVFEINGEDCESTVVDKFKKTLQNDSPPVGQ
jgi:hypothetical protein